jgi:hypothetical protein
MGKAATDQRAKRPTETWLEHRSRIARLKQDERDRMEPIAPAIAIKNGGYEKRFVTHVETNTKAETVVTNHDPVARWEDAGRLTKTQAAVIWMCRRLWQLAGLNPRVTANYGERIIGASSGVEVRALNQLEAREDLHRIQDYFPGPTQAYFRVFENVCRWGMAAGTAGAELGFGTRSAQERAHTVVCFVADVIATHEHI